MLLALAQVLLLAVAALQPGEPTPPPGLGDARPRPSLEQALDRVQTEARALQRRDLTQRQLTRHAVSLRNQVAMLPSAMVPRADSVVRSQARLSHDAGQALTAAARGDRPATRRAAGQLLGELDRLRLQLGHEPGENTWAPK
jgi:hypothetical protein